MKNDLDRPPSTLEDLKFVLATIARIKEVSLDVELRIADITERLVLRFIGGSR